MESAQPSNANNNINTRTQVPCLRDLNLADNMLGDDGVEGVAAGLAGHPCLEALVPDGNDVGLDGTASLCESLLQNASLRTLSLRRNSLLADSAEVIAGSFSVSFGSTFGHAASTTMYWDEGPVILGTIRGYRWRFLFYVGYLCVLLRSSAHLNVRH